jgi:hypothetical protein
MVLKRRRGQQFVEEDIINDQATQIALVFMRQYLINEDFRVKGSFYGMIQSKVVEVLYKKNPDEQILSLNTNYGDSDSNLEMGDSPERVHFTNVFCSNDNYTNPEAFINAVDEHTLITEILDDLNNTEGISDYLILIVHLYLILFLRKPKNRHSKKLFIQQWCKTYQQEQVVNLVIMELRNRYKELSETN